MRVRVLAALAVAPRLGRCCCVCIRELQPQLQSCLPAAAVAARHGVTRRPRGRYNAALIDAYTSDGWRGLAAEAVKPSAAVDAARSKLRRLRAALGAALRGIEVLDAHWPRVVPDDDGGELDVDAFVCGACGGGEADDENDLLLCDMAGCGRAVHARCVAPPLSPGDIPEDFFCPACRARLDALALLNDEFGTDGDSASGIFPELKEGAEWEGAGAEGSDDDDDPDFNPDSASAARGGDEDDDGVGAGSDGGSAIGAVSRGGSAGDTDGGTESGRSGSSGGGRDVGSSTGGEDAGVARGTPFPAAARPRVGPPPSSARRAAASPSPPPRASARRGGGAGGGRGGRGGGSASPRAGRGGGASPRSGGGAASARRGGGGEVSPRRGRPRRARLAVDYVVLSFALFGSDVDSDAASDGGGGPARKKRRGREWLPAGSAAHG